MNSLIKVINFITPIVVNILFFFVVVFVPTMPLFFFLDRIEATLDLYPQLIDDARELLKWLAYISLTILQFSMYMIIFNVVT